jgi:hypothetical protein
MFVQYATTGALENVRTQDRIKYDHTTGIEKTTHG